MLGIDVYVERGDFSLEARLNIPTPGVTAFFGASGAGKTTLAHTVTGLIRATGHITLDEETLLDSARGLCLAPERRGVACVFQDARLFPHLCIADNLDYGLRRTQRAHYAQRDEVIALLGLGDMLRRRPHELSGGERQRVGLGRALLAQPRLLVLDEPLASVDVARRGEVLPYLERLRDRYRIPMIYISHDYEEVLQLAAWVVVMDKGRVLAADTPSALSLSPSLQHRIRADAVGAVIESVVAARDEANALMALDLGGQTLRLADAHFEIGTRVRLQIPANEVILATELPTGLSVRNSLSGTVAQIDQGTDGLVLVAVRVGDQQLLARVTPAAVADLALTIGRPVWALVKAASLTGSLYRGAAPVG